MNTSGARPVRPQGPDHAEEEAAAEFEIQELFDDIGAAASEDEELAETAGVAEDAAPAEGEDDAKA